MRGANFSIYGGEYGYMYNPKILRFLLGDNVNDSYGELNPTRHSPILGWAYDGHPIYGPYAYVDKQNRNPFNQLKQMTSSIESVLVVILWFQVSLILWVPILRTLST